MYIVHGNISSGNCYKVKLLMQLLGIEHQWQHVDLFKKSSRETNSAKFLAINNMGQVPVLQISEKEYLPESNAILNYLAEGTEYLPADQLTRARVLQWQFFEQHSHEPYIAISRNIRKFEGMPDHKMERYKSLHQGGHRAFVIIEKQLSYSQFLVGDSPTIADISLYAFTHVADEGGYELTPYPKIKKWMNRIKALPNYIEMSQEGSE